MSMIIFTKDVSASRAIPTGFTLIEAMIAITVLTLSVAGPLFTASRAIDAAQLSSYQLTASYLGQESIEYMRAMRDDEYLLAYKAGDTNISTTAWNNFLNGSDPGSITQCRTKTCTFDPTAHGGMGTGSGFALNQCTGSTCTPLYLAGGVYTQQNYSGATVTPFTRTVQAIDVSTTEEKIVSTVSWNFHGTPYSVVITDHLTPWQ
jgi:Tfp pilus assembly protein PilV